LLSPEEKKDKDFKTFKRLVAVLLAETYSMHGYQDLAVSVAEVITELAALLVKRRTGKDVPITLEMAKGKLRRRYGK